MLGGKDGQEAELQSISATHHLIMEKNSPIIYLNNAPAKFFFAHPASWEKDYENTNGLIRYIPKIESDTITTEEELGIMDHQNLGLENVLIFQLLSSILRLKLQSPYFC